MTVLTRPIVVRCFVSVFCLSTFVLASGCGKKTAVAKVSGMVTLDGQPLQGGGTVTFEGSKGGASGTINPDGTYSIPNVPVGEVKIALTSGVQLQGVPSSGEPKENKVKPPRRPPDRSGKRLLVPLHNIPEKYSKSETSGLTYTVKPGDQTFDINLSR